MVRTLTPLIRVRVLVAGMIALLLAVMMTGCSRSVGERDVTGRYAASIGDERQVIEIRPGNAYENSFYKHGSLIWRREDRWSFGYEKSLSGNAITFSNFRFGFEQYMRSAPGFWPVKPERLMFGTVQLCFDPDVGDRCFVREKS